MTLTAPRPSTTTPNAPHEGVKRRASWWRGRRWPRAAAGLVLTVLCVVAIGQYTAASDEGLAVLVVAQPVAAGQVITEADLAETEIVPGDAAVVESSDLASVVGQSAAFALPAGTMLSPAMLGPAATPVPGRAEATVALAEGAYPAGLQAGAHVLVLADLDQNAAGEPWQLAAIVTAVAPVDGGAHVSLEFDAASAPGLAAARASDPILVAVSTTPADTEDGE